MSALHRTGLEVAVIGMSGRFPGAKNKAEFWQNLCNGVESVVFLSDYDLQAAGVPAEIFKRPDYIKAAAILEGEDLFDASFFGYTPREADIMDPQQRIFLEVAWEALEDAGYDPGAYPGAIGIYAGAGLNRYLLNVYSNRHLLTIPNAEFLIALSNDKDFLATRVSYKLNLRGPSITVQTACSTSLVAVHLACQGLLSGECDMALAGGVAIKVPQKVGYIYQEGGILSPDGHCRAFDAQAAGTIGGNGAGLVLLKRLEDALADRDHIYAVIKGTAINNDGALKVGFTAPSIDGQAEVIKAAQAIAEVEPETITYIEAHGTGTTLGDPIEIAALKQAFQAKAKKQRFCAIGSVKSNIGHLDSAAGVAGLIKTALALNYRLVPPSLHFEQPNPEIDLANSPFYVSTRLSPWPATDSPRRAGVSSFGMGGTNAHAVLEEAPVPEPSGPSRPWQLLTLSARTAPALQTATANLTDYLRHSADPLADIAYTLRGRRTLAYRRALVCRDCDDAVTALENNDPERVLSACQENVERPIAFMFPGQGAQYVNMALELYQAEPAFREQVERCLELLRPHMDIDWQAVLYPSREQVEEAERCLTQTAVAQPALFVIEYALARLWMEWGMHPQAMIGHSIGEYVAACLAGVFSLEDALALVAARGRLMQNLPGGAMVSVSLPIDQVQSLLSEELALAAVNTPSFGVVSGPTGAVAAFERLLAEKNIGYRHLHTSHAFHSQMMDPMLASFTREVERIDLKPPQIAFISNVSGTWITATQATSPAYWATHLRQRVCFADGISELLQEPHRVLLEVGPGRTLSTFAKSHPARQAGQVILPSLRHPQDPSSDLAFILGSVGRLWLSGVKLDWPGFYTHERRRRIPLPTYPFERQRYWLEGKPADLAPTALTATPESDVKESPAHQRPDLPNAYVPPRNELERTIAEIWQGLLGIEQVGIHDNFFELGGHSLLAIQLAAQLRDIFPIKLPMNHLFAAQTIAKLAIVIVQELAEEEDNAEVLQMLDEIEDLATGRS